MFSILCEDYGSSHKTPLLHTEMSEKDRLSDKSCLCLANSFGKPNELTCTKRFSMLTTSLTEN